MKKLLVILSVLLAICICFTSCNMGKNAADQNEDNNASVGGGGSSSNGNGGGGNKPQSGDAKQTIIDLFAKASDLPSLMEELQGEIDVENKIDEVYAELLKMEYQANFEAQAHVDGTTGSITGFAGMKNGNIAVNLTATAPDFKESSSAYGKFTEDLKFALAAEDGYGSYSTNVIDFGQYLNVDEAMGDLEGSLENSGVSGIISAFKLPELKASDIDVQDDLYVISNERTDYWKKVVDYTVDEIVNAMIESGAEIDEEEFAESKEMIKKALDTVYFAIGFYMNGSEIVGFGIEVHVTEEDLTAIMGEDADDDFHGFELQFLVKTNGTYLEFVDSELDMDSDEGSVNISFDFESLFDGDELCGMKTRMFVEQNDSYYVGEYDPDGNYTGSVEVTQNTGMNAEITLDLRNLNKSGSKVFDLYVDLGCVRGDGYVEEDLHIEASIESRGNNELVVDLDYTDGTDEDNSFWLEALLEYSEDASDFPEIPSSAFDAMDEAIENYVPGQGGIGGGFDDKVEEYPVPSSEKDYIG